MDEEKMEKAGGLFSALGGSIIAALDSVNSKRFVGTFAFEGATGYLTYLFASVVNPLFGLGIMGTVAVTYLICETIRPSDNAKKEGGGE